MQLVFLPILVLVGLFSSTAKVNAFEVYCVPSLDGVSTCSGWKHDEKLQCVSSPGGVASCRSSGGARFACTQDVSGLTTCENNKTFSSQSNQNCTAIGNGSFSCQDDGLSQTSNKNNNKDLNPISDIIGDGASNPIEEDQNNIPKLINKSIIIDTPSLKP